MLLIRRLPRFERKLDDLSEIISGVDKNPQRRTEHVFSAEKAILQIQIEWEHFVRGLVLDSATGRFSNRSGLVSSPDFTKNTSREAIAHTIKSRDKSWHLPEEAVRIAIKLNVSNLSQISTELGLTPWPIIDLRFIRNFIAHKSKHSALNVREAGLIPQAHSINVLDIALQYDPGGIKRYQNWINFTKGVAERLVT